MRRECRNEDTGELETLLYCPQCELLAINGHACHETGCPLSHIDPKTDKPYPVDCKNCGCEFTPEQKGQILCDEHCAAMYWGQPCDCDSCRELRDEDENDG